MNEVSEAEPIISVTSAKSNPIEQRWVVIVAALTMLLTLLPYLIAAMQSQGRKFMWLGYNLDDSCVYLSWMRQAADGSVRALNLFTTENQNGMLLNPFFLVLGKFAGITGLPLLAVYHGARLLFGFLLLLAVYKFISQTISDLNQRKTAFLFVCLGSGLGWLPFWWNDPAIQTPIDKWQPEAITFLSIYLSPLFAFSLWLQVKVISWLYKAQQTGKFQYAAYAGIDAFLLGLTHTYDVLSLAVIWLTYLLIQTLTLKDKQAKIKLWSHAGVAFVIAFPATAYIGYQLQSETVFRARANVKTLSPQFVYVLFGYGILIALAVYAAAILYKSRQTKPETTGDPPSKLLPTGMALLITWAVMNVIASYLPVAFQRKLLQGAHFPIAILAGIGFEFLLRSRPNSLSKRLPKLAATVLILSLTNLRFVAREMSNYANNRAQTMIQRPYLKLGELNALNWIAAHSEPSDAIQPLPYVELIGENNHQLAMTDASLACFTPGLINRKVYWGHWGETPDWETKLKAMRDFALPKTTDDERTTLLRTMKVRYLIFSQKDPADTNADQLAPVFRGRMELPRYLIKVYSNPDADVYEVHL